jgi:phosphate transport system protein
MLGGKKEFGRELESMHLDLIRMGGMIEEAIDKSIYSLWRSATGSLRARIIENDDKASTTSSGSSKSQCLRLLLRQQPAREGPALHIDRHQNGDRS